MTDITKAIAFAKECLKWEDACASNPDGLYIEDLGISRIFCLDSASEIQSHVEQFLGNRFFIQINRGTTSLFKWRVIVGLQNLSAPGARFDHARAESNDLYDAIFDACINAAHAFRVE